MSENPVFLLFPLKWKQKQRSSLLLQSFILGATMEQSSIFQMLNEQLLSGICFDLIRRGIMAKLCLQWNKLKTIPQQAPGDRANGNTSKTEQKVKQGKLLII